MDEKKLKAVKKEADEKAKKLSEEINVKVHPLVFYVEKDGEPVVGFLKEPNRMVKMACMDKYNSGFYTACGQVVETLLIKEHSDDRILSEKPEHDNYFMGAVNVVSELITFAANQADKKK
jgi:hypothetical protein